MEQSVEARFQTLHEIVRAAHANLNRNVWDYLIGGSETETSLARNRQAIDSIGFRPRVLCDVSKIDTRTTLFGKPLRIPVVMAPVGSLESFEPGGGGTVAEAAAIFGNGMLLSSVSEPGLEATAAKAGKALKIFQLYVRGDEHFVEDFFRRAMDNGYDAFCFTVDTAHYSRRERDTAKRYNRARAGAPGRDFQAKLTWRDIDRYRAKFKIPFILKGIATAEDASLAVEHGIDAVYVSNHGGRQLDHCLGSMEVLPEVVEAVNGRAKVIVDGGFYRGTDVVKAIAMGADVVSCGRLYVYGLAAAGAPGIVRVLEILEDEITICLALLGCPSVSGLNKSYVGRTNHVMPAHVHSAFNPLLDPLPFRY
jgi:isopentenyl diphosphate isomerase/L-lactate dehydrogenase-like FMN-dependent dehydrogenase